MVTLLKIIGAIWFGLGLWILWRNIAALSRFQEAVQPVGSPLITQQVLSTVLVFVVPGLLALALGVWFSSRRLT